MNIKNQHQTVNLISGRRTDTRKKQCRVSNVERENPEAVSKEQANQETVSLAFKGLKFDSNEMLEKSSCQERLHLWGPLRSCPQPYKIFFVSWL